MASTFHVENFGCRAARADGEAVSERLRAAGLSERARGGRCGDRQYMQRDGGGRPGGAGLHPPGAPAEPGGKDRGDRLLRPARAAGVGGPGGRGRRGGQQPQGAGAGDYSGPVRARERCPQRNATDTAFTLAQAASAPPQVVWADDRFAHSFLEEAQIVPGAQTRPNLKIQEGCGNRCTFCVIPQTRGPSKSLPAASVLSQVEGFVAAGGNELVLSGINLGRWGRDLSECGSSPSRTLAGLVREIFERTALPRLRLSSIEPMDWDAELIGLMAEFGGRRGWRVMRTCPCSPARTRCCGGCTGATGPGITWKR